MPGSRLNCLLAALIGSFSLLLLATVAALAAGYVLNRQIPKVDRFPAQAAVTALEQWARREGIAYQDAGAYVIRDNETYALMRVTAELSFGGSAEWDSREAVTECRKLSNAWQCDSDFSFVPAVDAPFLLTVQNLVVECAKSKFIQNNDEDVQNDWYHWDEWTHFGNVMSADISTEEVMTRPDLSPEQQAQGITASGIAHLETIKSLDARSSSSRNVRENIEFKFLVFQYREVRVVPPPSIGGECIYDVGEE